MATAINQRSGQRKSQQQGRSGRPHSKRHSSHGLSSKHGSKEAVSKMSEDVDDDVIGGSFLQYCTFCEKQITNPTVSVLYCSESCRKTDHNKTLSHADEPEIISPLRTFSSSSLHEMPYRDIVPQRSPTALNNYRFPSQSTYSDLQYSEEDQNSDEGSQKSKSRKPSEAARYLRQFRRKDSPTENDVASGTPRPRFNRSSTSYTQYSGMAPSLSHSPSSTEALSSLPFTPSNRPLPPRTNPFSTSSSYTHRSIDLVTPYAYAGQTTAPSSLATYGLKAMPISQTSMGVLAEGEILYAKTIVSPSPSQQGSLKQLFRFSEMQKAPDFASAERKFH